MKLALLSALVASASAFAPAKTASRTTSLNAWLDDNAVGITAPVGFFDPLGLSKGKSDQIMMHYREAELKHGRVAMAAFVGWWAVGAGLRFPGELAHGLEFSSIPSKGLEAWDAVPGWGKAQMLLFAGLIEFHDEIFFSKRGEHYLRGGTPGKNMVPGLFDPFNLSSQKSEEALAIGRSREIKNGRLAMLGVAGMYAAATIPGSVPLQPDC
jgi:hypothetical protein